MARKQRVWYPGAIYHITSRGIRKGILFYDDFDRRKYLSLLAEAKERFNFSLHAFCLMTNHVHLQIETHDTSPAKIMQYLNTKYGRYFNKKYEFTGHVFDKRYGSEIVVSAEYEIDLSKYIHLNPLKAKLVTDLGDYEWSSYRTYAQLEKSPLVTTGRILSYFGEPRSQNYINYLKAPFKDLSFIQM
jgi:putative transposase